MPCATLCKEKSKSERHALHRHTLFVNSSHFEEYLHELVYGGLGHAALSTMDLAPDIQSHGGDDATWPKKDLF